ncbi:MAG: S-adenosylmethionine:tRNA ribosyltransferase-isomerase [Leptospira sp.]|nr:S-adenosylmethionine:tRNA ribosyltransferase-isomerase [Leptospira sp.]
MKFSKDYTNPILERFNFTLDPSLIARFPAKNRDESKLMIIEKKSGKITIEPYFHSIEKYLKKNDLLVCNNTKVSKRRVYLKNPKGRIFETVFLEKMEEKGDEIWKCLLKNLRKVKENEKLFTETSGMGFNLVKREENFAFLQPDRKILEEDFDSFGNIPIPPYLKRNADALDEIRYQTVFGQNPGSSAAPTAGLHFTKELLHRLREKGTDSCFLELQVGYGTFSPLSGREFSTKKLHLEKYYVPVASAERLNTQIKLHQRVISVGTTTLRTLESVFDPGKMYYKSGSGETDIFILPGDSIQSADGLITNFHLPQSSLLLIHISELHVFKAQKLL